MESTNIEENPKPNIKEDDAKKLSTAKWNVEEFDDIDLGHVIKLGKQEPPKIPDLKGIQEFAENRVLEQREFMQRQRAVQAKQYRKKLILTFTCAFLSLLVLIIGIIIVVHTQKNYTGSNRKIKKDEIPQEHLPQVNEWHNYRLPKFIVPNHYNLFLNPNLTSLNLTGNVTIDFQVKRNTTIIVLHVLDLYSITATLQQNDTDLEITEIIEDTPNQQIHIKMNDTLIARNNYSIQITFEAYLKENSKGFRLIPPINKARTTTNKYSALTVFKPTNARRVFPCFDEPAMKATFQLAVAHDVNHEIYSNTKGKSVNKTSYIETAFETTPNMSTYSVAIVIGNFEKIYATNMSNIEIRIFFPSNIRSGMNKYEKALTTVNSIIDGFSKLVPKHNLTKLDIIGIPNLWVKVLSNWGLIIYNPKDSDIVEDYYTFTALQTVATAMSVGISSQFFANLITMEWWTDLWLEVGLANHFSHLVLGKYDNKMMQKFIVLSVRNALYADMYEDTPALVQEIPKNVNTTPSFEDINPEKSESICRMFSSIEINEPYTVMWNYSKTYPHSEVNTKNLPAILFPSKDTTESINCWIRQKGFPIIYATLKGRSMKLRQNRFPPIKSENTSSSQSVDECTWSIPVMYHSDNIKNSKYWLNRAEGEFELPDKVSWIKLNTGFVGFYRVMYNEELWQMLITKITANPEVFSEIDRSNLLDDAFTLLRANILKPNIAFNLGKYLIKEQEFLPWDVALYHLTYIYDMTQKNWNESPFTKYLGTILGPIYNDTKPSDAKATTKFRIIVTLAAIKCVSLRGISDLMTYHSTKLINRKPIPTNLIPLVYEVVFKHKSQIIWVTYERKYIKVPEPCNIQENCLIIREMAYTRDSEQIHRYFYHILHMIKNRSEDVPALLSALTKNVLFEEKIWKFIEENFLTFLNTFTKPPAIDIFVNNVLSNFKEQSHYDVIYSYVRQINSTAIKKKFLRALQKINANIFWKQNVETSVSQWLQEQYPIKK